MDFSEALSLMKQGKKVRRKDDRFVFRIKDYTLLAVNTRDTVNFTHPTLESPDVPADFILANDWEEVKE